MPMPLPTTTVPVALDKTSLSRAAQMVPEIERFYEMDPMLPWVGHSPPDGVVEVGYILTGALRICLTMWSNSGSAPLLFAPKAIPDVEVREVSVITEDLRTAEALARGAGVEVGLVLSCAVCSGLCRLAGDPNTIGPFLPG